MTQPQTNPWKSVSCECHAHADSHWFNEQNICDGCKISWNNHQKNPGPCPNNQRLTIAQNQKFELQGRTSIPKFRIYWNSHAENWTLLLKQKKQLSFEYATARNIEFIIQRKSQQTAIKNNTRSAHAFIQVDQTNLKIHKTRPKNINKDSQVSYNVFRNLEFTYPNMRPAKENTKLIFLKDGTVWEQDD